MEDIVQLAVDKKYTEFSDAVKQELLNKLGNSPEIKTYTSEYDRIQNMKSLFKQISSSNSSNSSTSDTPTNQISSEE